MSRALFLKKRNKYANEVGDQLLKSDTGGQLELFSGEDRGLSGNREVFVGGGLWSTKRVKGYPSISTVHGVPKMEKESEEYSAKS